MLLKVKRLVSEAKLPTKGHEGDHCFDFYAAESITFRPGDLFVVSLGVAVATPPGHALVLKERSGLALEGLYVKAGVIDEGYRGTLKVVLQWLPPHDIVDETLTVVSGDKICQGKLEATIHADVIEVHELDDTERGEGGFGSTGG